MSSSMNGYLAGYLAGRMEKEAARGDMLKKFFNATTDMFATDPGLAAMNPHLSKWEVPVEGVADRVYAVADKARQRVAQRRAVEEATDSFMNSPAMNTVDRAERMQYPVATAKGKTADMQRIGDIAKLSGFHNEDDMIQHLIRELIGRKAAYREAKGTGMRPTGTPGYQNLIDSTFGSHGEILPRLMAAGRSDKRAQMELLRASAKKK